MQFRKASSEHGLSILDPDVASRSTYQRVNIDLFQINQNLFVFLMLHEYKLKPISVCILKYSVCFPSAQIWQKSFETQLNSATL